MIPPRENPHLFGHAPAEAILAAAMRGARLHHAWLITGSEGIGKATFAFRAARRLLAGPPDGDSLHLDPGHGVFRRVAAAGHADLRTIARGWDDKARRLRTEIVVDDARAIADFLHLTPAEGGWRVVVLDRAEDLNRNAVNAVLKVLEEPPPRSVLFLTSAAPGRLPATLRSRCRQLRLAPLADDALRQALHVLLPDRDPAAREALVRVAEGSPGRALRLDAGGSEAAGALVAQALAAAPALDEAAAHAIADALTGRAEAFGAFMELLQSEVGAFVRQAARGAPPPARAGLLAARKLDGWVEVWQALGQIRAETEGAYLDRRQAVLASLALLSPDTTLAA